MARRHKPTRDYIWGIRYVWPPNVDAIVVCIVSLNENEAYTVHSNDVEIEHTVAMTLEKRARLRIEVRFLQPIADVRPRVSGTIA